MIMEVKQIQPLNKTFRNILRSIFSKTAIVLIGSPETGETDLGVWKTGKTNFGLKLSEILKEMQLIDITATNINTDGEIKKITDLRTLKYWLHGDKQTKLYILDEGNRHLPSRQAMTNKSVHIIEIFPEISKAHAKLIVIGQRLSKLDSELRDTGWVRARFLKVDLKTVYMNFRGEDYYFHNFPATSITYDPDVLADFTLEPTEAVKVGDLDLTILDKWSKGATWKELGFKHPMEANREYTKEARKVLDLLFTYSHT